jgi:hypothetical protein
MNGRTFIVTTIFEAPFCAIEAPFHANKASFCPIEAASLRPPRTYYVSVTGNVRFELNKSNRKVYQYVGGLPA